MTEGEATSSLEGELAQAERDEEWALLRLVGWVVLLLFIVAVLALSPWPWGALVGLVFWALGARGVYRSFSGAVLTTRELRRRTAGAAGATNAANPGRDEGDTTT